MRKSCKSPRTITSVPVGTRSVDRTIKFDGLSWGERELSQLIRRRMLTKETKNKKKYTRKTKHNNGCIEQ